MPAARLRRLALPLLLAWPPLALAGALSRQPVFDVASLVVLLAASGLLLLPGRQRPLAWLLWLLAAALLLAAAAAGRLQLALDVVPILATMALAWLFGHTLAAGRTPLVAQVIRVLEGEDRLQAPGVARYARQVTLFWTLLLAAQALVLGVLLLCSVPGGLLATQGWTSPLPVPQAWAAWYTHLGAWLLPVAAMALEYGFRRWHMRHVPQPSLHSFVVRLVACWPQLLRGMLSPSPR